MALIRTNFPHRHCDLILWKIEENPEELRKGIKLHPEEREKFSKLHHTVKQQEFLALRHCLKNYFGENPPVHYTPQGKPYLKNGPFISFSHTRNYAGVIISNTLNVGIDMELHRENIVRIAPKFLRQEESKTIDAKNQTPHTTAYWGAKEVIVKISGDRRLDFKNQIRIQPFLYSERQQFRGKLFEKNDEIKNYSLNFMTLDDLYITIGWQIN